ncbi:MAG: hypothetical protein HC862_26505 [Scytonema sp. RU_4_4]|nr:hypothetical protein [Scytonema sp. RU_4_4]
MTLRVSQHRLQEAQAIEQLLNKSVDGARTFLEDQRKDAALVMIASGEADTLKQALSLVTTGYRNPFRSYRVDMVLEFKQPLRPSLEIRGRIIRITDAFVEICSRNLSNMCIEKLRLRPEQIDACVVEEPSGLLRERIQKLLQQSLFHIERVMLMEMLKAPILTADEVMYLEYIESRDVKKKVDTLDEFLLQQETRNSRAA